MHDLGRELHSRLATMGGHVAKLGKQLGGAVDAYNNTVRSLECRVLVTARRFTELEVVSEELDAPEQVERTPRAVQAGELAASAAAALIALEPGGRDGPAQPAEDWSWVTEPLHRGNGDDARPSTVNG